MSNKQIIELYYEPVSPYSYFALLNLQQYRQIWSNIHIVLKPVQAGHIAIAAKNKTPGMTPIKGRYVLRDIQRVFKQYNIPCHVYRGTDHMSILYNSIESIKFLIAISLLHEEKLFDISVALSTRWWSQGLNFNDTTAFRAVCSNVGLSDTQIDTVLHEINSNYVQKQLDTNNNTMIKLGGFGVPTFLVHTTQNSQTTQLHPLHDKQYVELVFGSDRLQQIAWLIGQKWLDYMPNNNRSKL